MTRGAPAMYKRCVDFVIGDKVRHYCSDVLMVVEGVHGDFVTCVWFEDDKLRRKMFNGLDILLVSKKKDQ